MILGQPFPKRMKLLEDLVQTTSSRTYGLRFQEKFQYFPIYSIPLDLPKYRLKNGRTAAAQIEYLSNHPEIQKNIFTVDVESDQAQSIQHTILRGMVDQEGLFEYFTTHDQEIPLIITSNGFVVNGNRRICTMRELLDSEQKKYSRFRNIDVVILPPADEDDIDRLEAAEQIHPDITANYTWITRAVMYRQRMKEHGESLDYVESVYNEDKADIVELLDMLAHAEQYLKDRGNTGKYSLVEKNEYAFRQLRKFRPSLQTEAKKTVYDQLVYTLIDKPEGDRAYKAVADTAKYFDRIVTTIQSDFEINPSETNTTPAHSLLGGGPTAIVQGVLNILRDGKKRDEVRTLIREVLDSQNEKERESKKRNFVYSQVKKANVALEEAVAALSKDGSKQGVAQLIGEIEKSLVTITKWIHAKSVH